MPSKQISLKLEKEEYQYLKSYWVIPYREAHIKGRKVAFFARFWMFWFDRFPIEVAPITPIEEVLAIKKEVKQRVQAVLNWYRLSYWPAHAPRDAPIVISDDEDDNQEEEE